MAKMLDTRLTHLERPDCDVEGIVILDEIDETISVLLEDGDYHTITPEEYDKIKDDVITIRVRYAEDAHSV